ncbi:hypothetical protein ACFC34_38635 [Streptomyces sp. NPDC056053]|uniref:hypothetical protein n=1 Tax=Streptomyces sp. NPDC056053 TaxID=3345696 RepID=UPI0035DC7593
MRLRLHAAVQDLLADKTIAGQPDVAKLAAVVLLAKSRAPKGHKDDNVTSIWVAELGRWMGVGESTVHRRALAPLRASDGLHTEEVRNEQGYPTGLRCLVMPLWRARKHGGAGHPLALGKAELATLLRLCEVLFGHGWSPEGKEPTPPGLLAGRSGKGAATDRLGLLLMVLNTPGSGWLPLCSGSMRQAEKKHGRGAVTLARLLGCSPAGARKVLDRLVETGVVAREHRSTTTRMRGRGRVRLLPVARAYGRVLEVVQNPDDLFSARPGSAGGDLAPGGTAGALGTPGIREGEDAGPAENQERPDSAELHTGHASAVTPVVLPQLDCGFSGEGRGGEGRRPERACAREDGSPLRGDKQEKSPVVEGLKDNNWSVADAPVRVVDGAGQSRQQRGRAPLPPEDLRAILAPVDLVWARLERPAARRLVEAAARSELARVVGLTGRTDAPQVLADRVARRLEDQVRLAGPIKDPVGWLIGLALPQRQRCGDVRCDDRVLLDSGQNCPRCEEKQADRRDQHRAIAAAVDAAMPHASEAERRAATEQQLHQVVTARAWAQTYEWEQVRARQAATAQARAEAAVAQLADDVPAAPMAPVVLPAPRLVTVPGPVEDVDQDQELVLEDLTREQVRAWRVHGMKDHSVIFDHIDQYGETSARRLFSHQLVDEAQRLVGTHHLVLGHTTWGQA